ncbi:transducin beta-like protein 2 [Dioscorea cayenensis subsp. rotundata]|uniref:Transducin beta-like protein 2 n=1 Tax=Dioscorea cayennensis subsp. rotundata TaxID=55577 RepID=A0AB40CIZ2_DIOCR|nr:transducin beta-like protein 2 [Dioscorea cayenensis subsp. rotundata]
MISDPSSSIPFISSISIPLLTAIIGAVVALLFVTDYLRRKRSEVATIAQHLDAKVDDQKPSRPPPSKKSHPRSHHHAAADKDQIKRHHPLDVNTLKGHGDDVTALCFSPDGLNLATVCGDGVVRIFRIDDASSKSFKLLRLNLPAGAHPTAIAFSEGETSVVVAAQTLSGSSLYMYADVSAPKQQVKIPHPEIKWEHHKVHDRSSVLTLVGASATFGSGDGSTILASCSEGTDIKIWHGKSGKELGTVDTNQLKNNMATISPNGRFLAAAAFTADVKVWEIVYSKDGSVKEVLKVMQLKGHKSAVTCLCFTPSSEQIITASKDGSIRVWNINVRYHLDEDPKTLKVFSIPLHDAKGSTLHYDHFRISPDGKILAATSGSILQWLCAETGKVLDTADKSHEGVITGIAWAPQLIPAGGKPALVLATAAVDKKVKLWLTPELHSS